MNMETENCVLPTALGDAIEAVRRSGLFDEFWYRTRYPDVNALGMDPIGHYIWLGKEMGRRPFGNPDVKAKIDELVAAAVPAPPEKKAGPTMFDKVRATGLEGTADLPGASGSNAVNAFVFSGNWPRSGEAIFSDETDSPYRSPDQVTLELATLRTLGKFDPVHYRKRAQAQGVHFAANQSDPDALLRHFLLRGSSEGLAPNADFDVKFYSGAYTDFAKDGFINPYVHYVAKGWRQGRFANSEQFDDHMARSGSYVDLELYRRQFDVPPDTDPLEHYFLVGRHLGALANGEFSSQYYLRRFPDILSAGVPELAHYMLYGKKEGRLGLSPIKLVDGAVTYDPVKPTILIANHEASHTGAPILGLALVRAYSQSHNVITHCLKGGPLLEAFRTHSVLLAEGTPDRGDAEMLLMDLTDRYALTGLIGNSVEAGIMAVGSLIADVPCVTLIHEFAESTMPPGKMSTVLTSTDRAIVPAGLVRKSAVREASIYLIREPRNITVRPQGYIAGHKAAGPKDLTRDQIFTFTSDKAGRRRKIVLGGGYVQIRKGTDLFIQTAQQFHRDGRDDVCFLWIGDGYQPDTDLAFSTWLKTLIDRANLGDVVKFLPGQADFTPALEACDVFYLPSRLDPFPNVVVDALAVGKPVVCFENGTGVAELFAQHRAEGVDSGAEAQSRAEGTAVAYCDVPEAAQAIAAWLDRDDVSWIARNAELIEHDFRFSDYVSAIDQELASAIVSRRRQIEQRKALMASGLLDLRFHIHDEVMIRLMHEQIVADYVAKITKGLLIFNPRPGFSDGLYLAEHPEMAEGSIPLLDAAEPGKGVPSTHMAHDLDLAPGKNLPKLRIALHLHLHYMDLAPLFFERLRRIGMPIDVLVTTTGHDSCAEAKHAFRNYGLGTFDVLDVPNIGRDIGPFVTEILPRVSKYDVVGHLHGKKTLWYGGDIGQKWREFLLDNLMGDAHHMRALFNLFQNNARLGLVFAEDRKAVGWAQNLEVARNLAKRLDVGEVPGFPVFPIGTMFWARPQALAPLSGKLDWTDYPSEPLADDGTILHALERLLPSVCRAAAFDWETVYRRGLAW